ncbi:MAG TPA: ComEC/Rec2 family competence protein, partial [Pyrinomonadaceae bacterium]|nr:ComEC/Rec2 family competence protein [Pyrinomonadaceae bacterium]
CAALALSAASAQLASPFVWTAETATRMMAGGVKPFASAGVAGLRLPEYSGAAAAVYALYFVPLIVIARALLDWRPVGDGPPIKNERPGRALKLASVALIIMLVVIIAHPSSAGGSGGRLRVDFLDVGQGDAALITTPDGTTLLVDGGGRPRFAGDGDGEAFEPDRRGVGDSVVSEYLWWRGLARVNYLFATHADADHAEGLGDVARNFGVGAAFVARAPAGDEELARFTSALREAGVPAYLVGRGDRLRLGGVTIEALWPPPVTAESARGLPYRNDDSLVLRVSFGRRRILLTGDIETAAERALVAARDALDSDALKVAHHGSRTSTTEAFLNAVRPSLAVISVGTDSPHGHPHTSVTERLRAAGVPFLTTGERGTITVSTDGEDLRVETFVR